MDRIADLQHLVKGIDQNDLIAVGFKEIIDLLNIRFILRQDLLDTRGVGNIRGSRQINERDENQDHQCVRNAKHDGGGFERLTADSSGTSDHFCFFIWYGRGHLDIDRFGGKGNTKLGSIRIYRASRERLTVTENVNR